jgi:hypothetical protein
MRRIFKNDNIVLGSRIAEGGSTVRRGTVIGIYTDRHMREEVVTVKWDVSYYPNSVAFITQIRRIK